MFLDAPMAVLLKGGYQTWQDRTCTNECSVALKIDARKDNAHWISATSERDSPTNKNVWLTPHHQQKMYKGDLNTLEASGPTNLYEIGSLRNFIGYPQQLNVAVPQKRLNMQYRGNPTEKHILLSYIGTGYKQPLQRV